MGVVLAVVVAVPLGLFLFSVLFEHVGLPIVKKIIFDGYSSDMSSLDGFITGVLPAIAAFALAIAVAVVSPDGDRSDATPRRRRRPVDGLNRVIVTAPQGGERDGVPVGDVHVDGCCGRSRATTGLTMRKNPNGSLAVLDSVGGGTVFAAPKPMMYDSSKTAEEGPVAEVPK